MPRYLGQHFLKDKSVLRKIAKSLELRNGDIVVEIGPGHGELTDEILKYPGVEVIAIEKDKKLCEFITDKFSGDARVKIIKGDALRKIPLLNLKNYKIAGNIPYYITGHLLRIIGELKNKPARIVLLIQKEVAERICAVTPRSNLLSLSVQFWAEPKMMEIVPKEYFSPPPKVESAVIVLETLSNKGSIGKESGKYYEFIKKAFKQPRKTLFNNLVSGGFGRENAINLIKSMELEPDSRPSQLSKDKILSYLDCS